MAKHKLIRISTIPISLNSFCREMLRELSETYDVVALSSPGDELDEIAQREEVKTIAIPMERRISPFKDFISLIKLVRVFKRERPTIVHSITPKAGLLSMVAAKLTGVPIRIHTFTGLVFPTAKGFKQKLLIQTDKITCACATHIIPEGDGVKHDLETFGITRKPMQVLGYGNIKGVDITYFTPCPIPHNRFTFLYVGRIAKDKGLTEMVEAFTSLSGNAELIIVGRLDNSDPIPQLTAKAIEQHPNIHLMPATTDVRPYYNQADCLILPSYREGFPNVVLEAGAMELPCIVTDINGSREIITNLQNGLIVPSHSTNALHDAMTYMIKNPLEAHQMGLNARPVIINKFEQSFVRKCLYDYYNQIIHAL